MPTVRVIETFACDECGQVYDTYDEAEHCEVAVLPLAKFFVRQGEKFVERVFISAVAGLFDSRTRQDLTRNIDEVPIWEAVGFSHQVVRRVDKWHRSVVYVLTDGLETVHISSAILERSYSRLDSSNAEAIVRDVLSFRSFKQEKKRNPERLEKVIQIVDDLIARANDW